jgi:hypothetical protein
MVMDFEIENEIQFQYVSLIAVAAMVKKIRHATIEIDGDFRSLRHRRRTDRHGVRH